MPDPIEMACPERAVLELLVEVGLKQSLEEARNLFDGLRSPRKDIIGELLSCCTRVKAVRLFLTWSSRTRPAKSRSRSMLYSGAACFLLNGAH